MSEECTIIRSTEAMVNKAMVPVSSLTRGSHAIVECECPLCGDVFRMKYCEVVKRGHSKCRSCRSGGLGNRIIGKVFGRLTVAERVDGSRVRVTCACGTVEVVEAGQLLAGKKNSCGCLVREHMSEVGKLSGGNKHWNWQGGRSAGRKRRSADKEHRAWAKAVMERDSYTCQNCNRRDGAKAAHHLSSYEKDHLQRYNVDNGITLCYGCHQSFHAHYGNECSPEDYAEFSRKYQEDPDQFRFKSKPSMEGRRKLTWDRVRKLREWYASQTWKNSTEFCRLAAAHYGMNAESIRVIIKNEAWVEHDIPRK